VSHGETSFLSPVWAVLDLIITHATNGATFTDLDRQHLYQLKCQAAEPATLEEITAVQTHRQGTLCRGEFTAAKGRNRQSVRRSERPQNASRLPLKGQSAGPQRRPALDSPFREPDRACCAFVARSLIGCKTKHRASMQPGQARRRAIARR
jgi:hypothetical protein